MSFFYDPATKKTKPWVKIFFILIPVAMVILLLIIGQGLVKKKSQTKQSEEEKDIFKQF